MSQNQKVISHQIDHHYKELLNAQINKDWVRADFLQRAIASLEKIEDNLVVSRPKVQSKMVSDQEDLRD